VYVVDLLLVVVGLLLTVVDLPVITTTSPWLSVGAANPSLVVCVCRGPSVCVAASSFVATVCCEGTVASHLLAATMYKVSLPSRQPLAPPPLFACAFLLVVPVVGTFFGLKGFVVVVYYSSVLDNLF
jgi:hypothetical protein